MRMLPGSKKGKTPLLVALVAILLLLSGLSAHCSTIFVKPDGDDTYDGSSWSAAKATIDSALSAAASGDEVWVAAGTYIECITIPTGVSVYGGFNGTETTLSQRNWRANTSTIDANNSAGAVLMHSNTRIDGFTITNGYTIGDGGGIYTESAGVVIENNVIANNSVVRGSGGGVCCRSGDITIRNNRITGNSADAGGGIYCDPGCVITNNVITRNTANNRGGGIAYFGRDGSFGYIIGNTVADNTSPSAGGIHIQGQCDCFSVYLMNNIVAFNSSGIYRYWSNTTTHSYNCVSGNTDYDYSGLSPDTTDVLVDPLFANRTPDAEDYHILFSSPCIDVGNPMAPNLTAEDIDGETRQVDIPNNGFMPIDIGADEFHDVTPPTTPTVNDGDYTDHLTQLSSSWTSEDPDSGIVQYQYAIGTTPGGTDVVGWTTPANPTDTSVTATGLSLTYGKTYFFSVKAQNGFGTWSAIGVSDGVVVGTGLKNGDFELGFTNGIANYWTTFNLAGDPHYASICENSSPSDYAQQVSGSTNCTGGIYQRITNAIVNATYNLSVYIKGYSTDSAFKLGFDPLGGTDPTNSRILWSTVQTPGITGAEVNLRVVAEATSVTVFLKYENKKAAYDCGYIDDVTFSLAQSMLWDQYCSTYQYRQLITLNAASEVRSNVPMFVRLEPPVAGKHINTDDIKVYEVTTGTHVEVNGECAWAQPSGKVTEVFFKAADSTPANIERRFYVYYNLDANATPYQWNSLPVGMSEWRNFTGLDFNSNGTNDGFRMSSAGSIALQRRWNETSNKLIHWRDNGNTLLEKLDSLSSWVPVEGFQNFYTATDGSVTKAINAENESAQTHVIDADSLQMAISFNFSIPILDNLPAHTVFETYRLFKDDPWCEFVITVGNDANSIKLCREQGFYDPRYLCFNNSNCNFDMMISDAYEAQTLTPITNTNMHWLISYNSSDNKAVGWLMFNNGPIYASKSSDGPGAAMYNVYDYSAEEDNTYRYLWVLSDDKDELVSLFKGMATGWRVGDAETHGLRIVSPQENDFYLKGDIIRIDIIANKSVSNIEARWERPSDSYPTTYEEAILTETETGLHWQALRTVGETEVWGVWKLHVIHDGVDTVRTVNVQPKQTHPRVMFTSDEFVEIQSRRNTTHTNEWNKLITRCNTICDATGVPKTNISPGDDCRWYHQDLLTLALVERIEPGLSSTNCVAYKDKMWEYFWTMLHYPQWDETPMWVENNKDLNAMHYIFALSVVYDWYYEDLSSAERLEVRNRLLDYQERALECYGNFDYTEGDILLCNPIAVDYSGLQAVTAAFWDEMSSTRQNEWSGKLDSTWTEIKRAFSADGTSSEGWGYNGYYMDYLTKWLDMRGRFKKLLYGEACADCTPFSEHVWLANNTYYYLYGVVPGGTDTFCGVANYGDCPFSSWGESSDYTNSLAKYLPGDVNSVDRQVARYAAESIAHGKTDRFWIWRYLYKDPAVQQVDIHTLPNWRLFDDANPSKGRGLFVWRSSWANDATYFTIKSGSHESGHDNADDGQFMLYRNGMPYIIDPGYSWKKSTAEHNVLVVNDGSTDTGQKGEGGTWFNDDEAGSGEVLHLLASGYSGTSVYNCGRFFDYLCNPQPTYINSNLTTYTREVVGFEDLFLIRDCMSADTALTYKLPLHSAVFVDMQPSPIVTYGTDGTYDDIPWSDLGSPWYTPKDATPKLGVWDVSGSTWSASVQPTMWVPQLKTTEEQYGGQLLRTIGPVTSTSSLIALGFSDHTSDWTLKKWSDNQAEGIHVDETSGNNLLDILWPLTQPCINSDGWTVTGAMAGKRYIAGTNTGEVSYFARDVSSVINNGVTLIETVGGTATVSVYAQMEFTPSASNPNRAKLQASGSCEVMLYCPYLNITVAELDDDPIAFNYDDKTKLLTIQLLDNKQHVLTCY